jgi:hypothetical protein
MSDGTVLPAEKTTTDFPVTRRIMERLDAWMRALAAPLLPLNELPVEARLLPTMPWRFAEEKEPALLIGKAVRMVSGIKVAFMLAEQGHISECGVILRTVSDFGIEIDSVSEGYLSGAPTAAQKRFVEQYFAPLPKDPDEYELQSREQFVTREELIAANSRLAAQYKFDYDRLRKVMRFLSFGLDKCVHGAYITALELYDPYRHVFMTDSHIADEIRQMYMRWTASKLHEVLSRLVFIARFSGSEDLLEGLKLAARELYQSGELLGDASNLKLQT